MAVRLVVGPPASGKSTYISEHAADNDVVIDFDSILEFSGGDRVVAERLRNVMEAGAASHSGSDVWIARTLPDPDERAEFCERVGITDTIVLNNLSRDELLSRSRARGDDDSVADAIDKWFSLNAVKAVDPAKDGIVSELVESASASNIDPVVDGVKPEHAESSVGKSVADMSDAEKVDYWKSKARLWESRAKENYKKTQNAEVSDKDSTDSSKLSELRSVYEQKLFAARFDAAASKFPGRDFSGLRDSLNLDSFRSEDGDIDQSRLDSLFESLASTSGSSNGLPSSMVNGEKPSAKAGSLAFGAEQYNKYKEKKRL